MDSVISTVDSRKLKSVVSSKSCSMIHINGMVKVKHAINNKQGNISHNESTKETRVILKDQKE